MSKPQMAKLKKGAMVRIKRAMEGEGVCLIVNPSNYSRITKSFSRDKGSQISMSPDELDANANAADADIEGEGLFKKIGKTAKKATKTVKRVAKKVDKFVPKEVKYAIGRELKELGKEALPYVLDAGAGALSAVAPEFSPAIIGGEQLLKHHLKEAMDDPSRYSRKNIKATIANSIMEEGLGNARGHVATKMDGSGFGSGLYAGGSGLYAGRQRGRGVAMGGMGVSGDRSHHRHSMMGTGNKDIVGQNGGFVQTLPAALQSQPFSANFQFANMLPPAYQKFSRGAGLGY
tara:strand:- start:943 stop:1809 length:867 start_codon:yes stop_codon:yes gene_type:complete